jgi:hypothetical protein
MLYTLKISISLDCLFKAAKRGKGDKVKKKGRAKKWVARRRILHQEIITLPCLAGFSAL